MRNTRILTVVLLAGVLALANSAVATGQGFEDKTYFTFDAPVQVPGAVLTPGRYYFELLNPEQPRRSIEVRKDTGQALVTTVAIPTKRLEPEDVKGVQVTFISTTGDQPPAIKSWFYPGEMYGHMFVYPEEQAKRIAEATKTLVLAADDEGMGDLFLIGEGGERQAYGDAAQESYAQGGTQAPNVQAAKPGQQQRAGAQTGTQQQPRPGEQTGTTGMQARSGSDAWKARVMAHLNKIEELVQRGLAPQPEAGTVGTMGSNKDQVTVSRNDLRLIQQYVANLRRELDESRAPMQKDPQAQHMMSGSERQTMHEQMHGQAKAQQSQQQGQQQGAQQERPVGTAGAMTATVEEIMDNSARFYGNTVTVAGEVNEIFGAKSFNIQEEGILDVDDNLLVLSNKSLNLTGESRVTVTGKVRSFVKADLEREFDITDWTAYGIDEDFFVDYDRRPVLIADSVEVRGPQAEESAVGTAGAGMTTIEEIMDNSGRFYGDTVTVAGEVNEVFGRRTFNIQEEGIIDVDDNLLIISNKPLPNLTGDSMVTVTGKVRSFVKAELEREYDIDDWYGLDYGLDEDFFVTYERRPVLIADSVEVRRSGERK